MKKFISLALVAVVAVVTVAGVASAASVTQTKNEDGSFWASVSNQISRSSRFMIGGEISNRSKSATLLNTNNNTGRNQSISDDDQEGVTVASGNIASASVVEETTGIATEVIIQDEDCSCVLPVDTITQQENEDVDVASEVTNVQDENTKFVEKVSVNQEAHSMVAKTEENNSGDNQIVSKTDGLKNSSISSGHVGQAFEHVKNFLVSKTIKITK